MSGDSNGFRHLGKDSAGMHQPPVRRKSSAIYRDKKHSKQMMFNLKLAECSNVLCNEVFVVAEKYEQLFIKQQAGPVVPFSSA